MCGIAGVVNLDGKPVDPRAVLDMRDSLAHRGPDGSGLHVDGPVGLGHRRLAIVDLNPRAAQPMSSEDGQLWLVFNGEIYNYVELRAELQRDGHRFRSESDTEVILHLYQQRGDDLLRCLRGMFAFALWDGRRHRLLAGRDRLGKKPLYFARTERMLAFASEVKALLRHPAIRAEPRWEAVHDYLALDYVPSPGTAFEGIERVPPAHCLVLENGQHSVRRYWQAAYVPKRYLSEVEAEAQLQGLIQESVKIRLRSDVPLGVHLSGGLDSSVVAAVAAAQVPGIRTFSIGFEDPECDESPHARRVAAHIGSHHREFVMRPSLVEMLPRMAAHYDQPFADPAALATFYLCQHTREEVTVALNGDGGDEIFGGYARYRGDRLRRVLRTLPAPLRSARVWDPTAGILGALRPSLGAGARRAQAYAAESRAVEYCRAMTRFQPDVLPELYGGRLRERLRGRNAWATLNEAFARAEGQGLGPLDTLLSVDSKTYLPDCLLVKVDVASMAWSLEVRSPLLDHQLVEFAAALPESMKVKGTSVKYLLKRVAASLLPPEILARPKAGFVLPLARWFREELRTYVRTVLLDGSIVREDYLRADRVAALIDEHQDGRQDHGRRLWTLLMLQLWHDAFFGTAR
jgi:asparagine synthase (glutamine-hydrolysing)